ncbi:hypothetical protein P24_17247 [Oceanibaculum indicum P24]|uniref:Uncharacterized protein n=2 Tax=Oceanibaculum indicum TaxID=526216 RepID=K2JDU1_9PROT|nr:hypothetical protein P24_17247 [Oceanibaculum indicum P24]
MGAAAHIPSVMARVRPVCGAAGCREAASVELPFCRAHWRALPAETRRAIVRQWRIGYGTGAEAASFQTADAVRSAREFLAESQAIARTARVIEAASADLLRRAEACVAHRAAGRAG